jgi:hypothetical protein
MSASRSPVTYSPIALNVGMTDQGYRFVTVAVAPGRVVRCTIAAIGTTESEAIQYALTHCDYMFSSGEVK